MQRQSDTRQCIKPFSGRWGSVVVVKSLSFILAAALLASLLAGCSTKSSSHASRTTTPTEPAERAERAEDHGMNDSEIRQVDLHSIALDRDMGFTIYLPPGYDEARRYPVLYLFYGYGGNRDSWFTGLNIHRVADRLIGEGRIGPLLIVSPSYGNSFGVNSQAGEGRDPGTVDIGRYEDYLIQEVIPYVDGHFGTLAERKGRYIGGASMGGYAALYLGFTYPELFSKIGAHSAAVWNYTPTDLYTDQRDWLYATSALREARDPFLLAASGQLDGLKVYLDAGDSDPLSEKDKHLYTVLVENGVQAQWVPSPGGHSGTYWASRLESYLQFYDGTAALP